MSSGSWGLRGVAGGSSSLPRRFSVSVPLRRWRGEFGEFHGGYVGFDFIEIRFFFCELPLLNLNSLKGCLRAARGLWLGVGLGERVEYELSLPSDMAPFWAPWSL